MEKSLSDIYDNYQTEMHLDESGLTFNNDLNEFHDVVCENDFNRELKTYFRFFRKKIKSKFKERFNENFTKIIYLTLDCSEYTPFSQREDSPLDYIAQMRKQYPDLDIRIIIPLINLNKESFKPLKKISYSIGNNDFVLEKTFVNCDFFIQNKEQNATLYRFPQNNLHIQVYGLYCEGFSFCKNIAELIQIENLAPFIKASRVCIKKLSSDICENFKVDIVHCENIPFYLGRELEHKWYYGIKVFQTVKDFTQLDLHKVEAFWAAINVADKNSMKKICRDNYVKKCIACLFKLHNTKRFYQMRECLNYIYKNYYKFRKYVDKGSDLEENIIFNKLNKRILQLFPQMVYDDENHYNVIHHSVRYSDFWATTSKTYYKELLSNAELSGKMYETIMKTKEKSTYVLYGFNPDKYPTDDFESVYNGFNKDNFRENRRKNKILLLKEFSSDRIKTNFTSQSLFKNEDFKITGYLDSFYPSPLFFINTTCDIFANGVDIMFNTILKLFEYHKNVQVIIAIKGGLKNHFIKSWVDFLSQNKYLAGRWIFIDGDLNLSRFYSAADMALFPRRINMNTIDHFVSMHYGCVPIVSRSGILNDTVADIFDDITHGSGFKTKKVLMIDEDVNEIFLVPVMKALKLYQDNPSSWNLLVKNCMNYDGSWNFSILEKYYKIYKELV